DYYSLLVILLVFLVINSRICINQLIYTFFFSSRRRHTISKRDWSSDVCSSDLLLQPRQQLVDRDDDVSAGVLVIGGGGLLDPFADLLQHPDGVEVPVALQPQPVGQDDPHVAQGPQQDDRLFLVDHHLAVLGPGGIDQRDDRLQVGELGVREILLDQPAVLLGEVGVAR